MSFLRIIERGKKRLGIFLDRGKDRIGVLRVTERRNKKRGCY
jgi:hypothetical protein